MDFQSPVRIVALQREAHGYDECFYTALEKLGVQIVNGSFSLRWLAKHLNAGEYAHLQYPSFCYAAANTRVGLLFRFIRFVMVLLLVRMRGAKLLWTAHNLMPHVRTPFPGMDLLGRKIVIALSHRIFAHGISAATALKERFSEIQGKIALIQHGHWVDYYPHTQSKSGARAKLCVHPDAYVFLFIGICKEYKNLHGLVEVFRNLPVNAVLLIAGNFQRDDYRQRIFAMANGDQRIKIYPHYVPDENLQDFLGACDCVVLPYLDILTSGSAMLALSFGRPVVSVRLGCLSDIVTDDVGVLFDPMAPDGLNHALIEVRERHFDERRILAHALGFSWINSAQAFLEALNA